MEVTEQTKKWREDFGKYAKEVLQIQTKRGKIEPFKLNRFQRRLDAIMEEELAKPKGARVILLKARQLGSSTYISARQYHRTTLWPNQTALTLAHDLDTAEALHRKPLLFYNLSPKKDRPDRKLSNRRELQFSKDVGDDDEEGDVGLQSRIQIATAKDSHAGIGLTIHALHLSEAARYESVTRSAQDLFIGMMQAVPEEPGTMVVLETTAFGLGWFYELWNDEESGWRKVFVSWLAEDAYVAPEPLDIGVLEGADQTRYGNETALLSHVEDQLRFWYPEVYSDDGEGTAVVLRIEALKRLRWRREKIDTAFAGDKDRFRQEYPTTPEEAFLTSGNLVFDGRKLADYKAALSDQPEPTTYRFDQQTREFYQAPYGGLRIYAEPEPNGRYVIGADVGEGLHDKDFSAAQVIEIPSLRQVAVLQERLDPAAFGDALAALGYKYNTAFIGVEVNGPGFATNLRLSQDPLWYPLLYTRESFDNKTKQYLKRYGWHTNKSTKPICITDVRRAIREDLIRFYDKDTLDELGYYQQDPKTGKMDAAPGYNDDLVMSLAIALQMVVSANFGKLVPDESDEIKEGSWHWYANKLDAEMRRKEYT
jgi:hypothetical protein